MSDITKIDGLDETSDVFIIFDNGGLTTLVISDKYQHTYCDAAQCVADVVAYIADKNTDGWDGNELCLCSDYNIDSDGICSVCGGYEELDPTNEQIHNGGYRVCGTIAQIAIAASSFGNAQDFCNYASITYNNN